MSTATGAAAERAQLPRRGHKTCRGKVMSHQVISLWNGDHHTTIVVIATA